MELCDDCRRLSLAKGRSDVPTHLGRVATLRKGTKVTFQYRCGACESPWKWERGIGWVIDVPPTPATPLLARIIAAARSHSGPHRP